MAEPNPEQIVLDALKYELGLKTINPNSTIESLGLDSLGYVRVSQIISEKTGIELDDYMEHRAERRNQSYNEIFRQITPEHFIGYVAFALQKKASS